ncbi:MAG: aminopeptidase [Candidatus Promineifilaceae bacterium]
MTDPRVTKLAQVLVSYSLALKPGQEFLIVTSPSAEELSLAVYKEALLAGANIQVFTSLPGAQEFFFKRASDEQLDHISPVVKYAYEHYDAILNIDASSNTRSLSSIDPARMQRVHQASADLMKRFLERMASGELKWCLTVYPTNASAQEADMSLSEYQDFVYGAGLLGLDDPVAAWREESARQQRLIDWLDGHDQVKLKGSDIDLRMSIKGRKFMEASGRENFPDGEIYTSPVEASVNGWVRFAYPAIYTGREVTDIELWFEDGKVVKESAAKGQDLLTALLDTDEGARHLGEWGIGTNYGIQRFTKNMLFDEKMGGTIHLAVGAGFPEIGSQNQSGLHWDMLCDMADSEVTVDGQLFYKDGKAVVE